MANKSDFKFEYSGWWTKKLPFLLLLSSFLSFKKSGNIHPPQVIGQNLVVESNILFFFFFDLHTHLTFFAPFEMMDGKKKNLPVAAEHDMGFWGWLVGWGGRGGGDWGGGLALGFDGSYMKVKRVESE